MKKTFEPKFNARKEARLVRRQLSTLYYEKYFSLWINSSVWEGITDEERRFIMKEWWNKGSVACFKVAGTEGSSLAPEGKLAFAPYAVNQWDMYYAPLTVNLVNLKGSKVVPSGSQKVNEDAVIGWAHRSHKPVVTLIQPIIDRLVDTEMVIRMNLKAQKMPWLIAVTPETESKMRELANALEEDDPMLFVELGDADKAQSLLSGSPFILDKLYNYKQALESEIREMMGLGNLGFNEKKEHLITGEIQANDEVTQSSYECFIDEMGEFVDRIKEYLKVSSVKVSPKVVECEKAKDDEKEGEAEDGEEAEYDS